MHARTLVGLFLTWLVTLAPASAEEPKGKDAGAIEGKWVLAEVHRDGMAPVKQEIPAGIKDVVWEFGGGTLDLVVLGQKGKESSKYKVDASKTPKELDWTLPDGKTVARCVYQVKDNQLWLCFQDRKDPAENKRPKGFRTEAGDGTVVFVFNRE